MAFNEFDDRGRVHVISDDADRRLYLRKGMFGDTLAVITEKGDYLFGDEHRDSLRGFANAILRWCDTGAL